MIEVPIVLYGEVITVKQTYAKYKDEIPKGLTRKNIITRIFTHKWKPERAFTQELKSNIPKKKIKTASERSKQYRLKLSKEEQEFHNLYLMAERAFKPIEREL